MVKGKELNNIMNRVFNKPVVMGMSAIIGGYITTQMTGYLSDFIFFFPVFAFITYGVIKTILFVVERVLQNISKQEINNSIPVGNIKSMLEKNYIEVPQLGDILQAENEKIPSDKNSEYLLEQEKNIRELLIKSIHEINPRNSEYFKELKEGILNNISEETSIRSLYNMLTTVISNSEISILNNHQDHNSIEALNKFYDVIGDMSRYNYALDLNKYEKRRNNLYKYVNHGNYLIDQFIKEMSTKIKGDMGEKAVEKEIALYEDYLTYLSNVRVEVDDTSIETDGIIVCDKGVFALEIKNYGNENDTIILRKDGKLSIVNKYKGERQLDFLSQHNRHCGLKQKLINNELRKSGIDTDYIIINPIIVIGNDKVNIVNESEIKILRASTVIHEILQIKENTLSKELQSEIINIINNNKLPLKSYDVINIESSLDSLLNSLVKGINYLIEVVCLNEKLYELIDANSYIDIKNMNIMNTNLFDGNRNCFYQIVINIKS